MKRACANLTSWVPAASRTPYRNAAEDGVFPLPFARLSRYGTPGFGLIVSSTAASLLILFNLTSSLVEIFAFITFLATLTTL